MKTKQKSIYDKLSEKYDVIIEVVKFNGKHYFVFTENILSKNFQITTESKKIVLFNNLKEICEYFKDSNKKELLYPDNVYKFINALRKKNLEYIQAYIKRTYSAIDFDYLLKTLSGQKIRDNKRILSIVYDVIFLLKDYFCQINDMKNLKKLKINIFKEYIDLAFENIIFGKDYNNKYYLSLLKKILKNKNFIKMINEFEKYSLIYKN